MVCSTETKRLKRVKTVGHILKMMDMWDYYNSLYFVFCFVLPLYLSPRTESLYLFFTQALGIQLWGENFAVHINCSEVF